MFGIETQGGKSGGQKAGPLLNITERERRRGRKREGREGLLLILLGDLSLHCHSLVRKFKFIQGYNTGFSPSA